ncbi:hypothetical protein QR77_28520, partial [Streptomyces sp. 150FB]|uniref:hypothetical protein n=1 Tax=Streptomyces sp. 150FB TaxID=1576605 RepID=UPI0005896BBC
ALPLLERQEERERLVELLGRGRSVRLVGAAGSGRTVLLEAAAADCAGIAPDGVVRLSGYRRTTTELLYDLYTTVYDVELRRPDRAELHRSVHEIGAVVVLDDLEFGGDALDELLAATPECAYLLAAAPDIPEPSAGAGLEEVVLGGIGRNASLELLERAVDRALTDEEANWAGDLWFESEGLPLRFVQAGALLRQRDTLRARPENLDDFEAFEPASGAAPGITTGAAGGSTVASAAGGESPYDGADMPLPSIGEGASPAALLASRLSASARATLRFAVALSGEVPHQAHLPALVGDTHADAALGELMSCGLLSPVGTRYRLASGVAAQLEAEGYADDAVADALTAAQHYAWWSGHPSVSPDRVAAESDAILASMGPLVPAIPAGHGSGAGHPSAAVLLARGAAPAFMAGLHWGAWERALRSGQEAARLAGEVAEEAYFHHELGVLALCGGNLERARAELGASIAMRGAVADRSGTVAGRRALALVEDQEGGLARPIGAELVPVKPRREAPEPPRALEAAPAIVAALPARLPAGTSGMSSRLEEDIALITRRDMAPVTSYPPGSAPGSSGSSTASSDGSKNGGRKGVLGGARRNLVAAGAGAVLAAVLGTVVTLGATSSHKEGSDGATTGQQADPDDGNDGLPAAPPDIGGATSSHQPGRPSRTPGSSGAPTPSGSGTPSGTASAPGTPADPSGSPAPGGGGHTPPGHPSTPGRPPTKPTHSSSPPTKPPSSPSTPPPTTPPPSDSPSGPTTPPDSASASGTAPGVTAGPSLSESGDPVS